MTNTQPLRQTAATDDAPLQASLANVHGLMEAMVAAYALMAHADGEAADAERRRIFSILRSMPSMSVFSRAEIAEEIATHEANYRYDPEVAQHLAWERLQPIAANPRQAAQVIAACREIIPADGVAHPAEYRALSDIRTRLKPASTDPAPPQRI